jgi:hypothetical protein
MESVKMKKATRTVAFRQLAMYCNIIDNQLLTEWEIDETGLCGVLPEEDAARGDKEEITLIPMGAARLRISAFPNTRE